MAKKKGGQLSKYRKEKLKGDIRALFQDGSIMYHSERELAIKFDVARNTIRSYVDEVAAEVGQKDITFIALELKNYLELAISDIKEMWEDSKLEQDRDEIRKNIDMMFKAIDKFTDFMERFFIKDKAVDKLAIHAQVEHQLVLE